MGKDKRPWRKLVKKLRRSRIRTTNALLPQKHDPDQNEAAEIPLESEDVEFEAKLHKMEEEAWKEREEKAQKLFQMKCEFQKFQAEQERLRKIQEEEELREKLKLEQKREEDYDNFLEFLLGNADTPPLEYVAPTIMNPTVPPCLYFSRTGACRFYDNCKKPHPKPTISTTLLIPNFFQHKSLQNENPNEEELGKSFLEFYDDVLPELQSIGKVIQFKISRNCEPHLCGSVYVQYENLQCAIQAYRKFHGRYYDGKCLSVQFVQIPSWKSAICGAYKLNRCQKGKSCNYLHSFRNPTREFVGADNDWAEITTKKKPDLTPAMESPRNETLILKKYSVTIAKNHQDEFSSRSRSLSSTSTSSRSGSRSRSTCSRWTSCSSTSTSVSDQGRRNSRSRSRSKSKRRTHPPETTNHASKEKKKKKHKKHKHKSKGRDKIDLTK